MKVLKWVDFGIFPGECLFSVGMSYDELMRELHIRCKKKDYWIAGIDGESEHFANGGWFACGRSAYDKKKDITYELYYIIITDQFDFSDWHFCKLAHEVLHICQFFLRDRLDRNKETEAEAYFHTHIMRQCVDALRAEKNKTEKQQAKNVRS